MNRCWKAVCSTLTALLICSLSFSSSVAEDEPLRGRLPDGRAFRTDSQGVQIVDYIAELELSIEALNRRVHGLEDELRECNELGGDRSSSKREVVEKDLFQEQPAGNNQQLFDLQRKLQACESRVREKEIAANNVSFQQAQVNNTCSADLQAKNREIALLETSLKNYRHTVETLKSKSESGDIDAFRQELARVKLDFDRYKLYSTQELKKANSELVKANKYVCKKCDNMRVTKARAESPRARFVLNNDSTFAPIRGQLQSEYNKLHSAIKVRDAKFKQYRARPQRINFSLSPLRSANRRSLESIKYAIWHENNLQALTALRIDLKQISVNVQDDIALIDRMMKVK